MDGAKNAMYAQAGRNHEWSRVKTVNDNAAVTLSPAMMREPPVVELPDFAPDLVGTIFDPQLDFMMPQDKCQEIAMAYVQMQKWQRLYETDHGFSRGTIFSELDLPFIGKGACKDE